MKKIMVLGGAGYIGSVAVKMLCDKGFSVIALDDLSRGNVKLVDKRAKFYKTDICSKEELENVFEKEMPEVVMHFAALKAVGESMEKPDLYSRNIICTINALNAMIKYNIKKIIFSSSCTVYGNVREESVSEDHAIDPINFYGFTKVESENLIKWYSQLKGISGIALRYFNVAGDGGLNYQDPSPQTIFPIVAENLAGKRKEVVVFGKDYNTLDGTGVRDYIHVIDLVEAHINALDLDCGFEAINLGTKKGYSVLEVINEFERLSGKKVNYVFGNRRPGDPAKVIAASNKAQDLLGWQPKLGLKEMVESTLKAYNLAD